MSDTLNRIAAALRELDQPESDAEIAAALDAIEASSIDEPAVGRIMDRVRQSIADANNPVVRTLTSGQSESEMPIEVTGRGRPVYAEMDYGKTVYGRSDYGRTSNGGNWVARIFVVAACAALIAIGLSLPQDSHVERPMLPSHLLATHERYRGVMKPNPAAEPRVRLGDTITTGPREKRRVTLPDGSVLSINERSKVAITGERQIKLSAGEVFVEVMPLPAADKFLVETPHRTVTALGTKFDVKAEDQSTSVVVTQGKVQVSGVEDIVPAGHELIADLTESKSAELRPAKRSAFVVEWIKDLLAAGSAIVPTSEHAGGTITVVDPNGQEMKLSLRKFHVDVHIEDGFARTTIDQTYFNHTWQQLEGTFRFPLPADASLSRLAMYVNGKLMEGGMVERDYGRNVFEQIRHTRRDPALLEWVDGSTFQMRVFPLEPRQEKRLLLSYTQRLPNDYGKSVYRFPAGHSLEGVREWSAHVRAKGEAGAKWYSPSHLLTGRDDSGDLVLDGHEDYATLDRDLIVEFGEEKKTPAQLDEEIRRPIKQVVGRHPFGSRNEMWSVCEQDGFQYAMLRYRPELQAEAMKPQRHWVLLVENSADRNDLLAETQRQIAKVLLDNAEHSDTFSLIRAGTEPALFRRQPVECTLENIDAAMQFLRDVAPIGALDLGQALQSVQKQAAQRKQKEVWIVHLGTGIPVLGERDDSTLLRLLPSTARYVGVAVGKRWSKSFMDTAATRSGGHVAQINPDEPVAWRAFDLLSTLNAPRLTEIKVTASETTFLTLTKSIAHGQELVAVARFPKGQALPKSIEVTGHVNGVKSQSLLEVPIQSQLTVHSHLPRTWARLEIDRLVSLGANEHKPQIIELSKSMYVMSPFTSLLVLETEAMYEQFHVDRGRKDHWAMYPAPAEIPVVTESGSPQLSPLDAAKERLQLAQSRAKAAQSNLERATADKRPPTDLQRFERIHRAEQAEIQFIEREITRIEAANAAASNPLRITWDSVIQRRTVWQQPAWLAGQDRLYRRGHWLNTWGMQPNTTWGRSRPYFNQPTFWFDDFSPGMPFDVDMDGDGVWDFILGANVNGNGNGVIDSQRGLFINGRFGNYFGDVEGWMRTVPTGDFDDFDMSAIDASYLDGLVTLPLPRQWSKRQLSSMSFITDGQSATEFDFEVDFSRLGGVGWKGINRSDLLADLIAESGRTTLARGTVPLSGPVSYRFIQPSFARPELLGLQDQFVFSGDEIRLNGEMMRRASLDLTGLPPVVLSSPSGLSFELYNEAGQSEFLRYRIPRRSDFGSIISNGGSMPAEWYWGVNEGFIPAAVVNPLHGVVQDLPSYAPGLQTWMSDRLAIVELAAKKKPARGEVDPAARQLIDKARSLGWESWTHPPGHPSRFMVIADRSGRFAFEREVSEGLKERVVCDGSTMWHLYPEIGLGAKRSVSRFHQAAIQSLIPWYVPSADDLSIEADVKLVGERTVRITALKREPREQKNVGQKDGNTDSRGRPSYDLVFSEDGRLAETRIVDISNNKVLAKQTFASDGTVRVFNADGKLVAEAKYDRQPADAPNLDAAAEATANNLVVLPLPYRSASGVPVSVPTNLQTNAPDYAKLSNDESLALLATYFAEARASELAEFIEQRFTARGDHRIGFAVLMSSVMPSSPLVATATKQHPNLPLAKFLEQYAGFPAQHNLNGTLDAGDDASPFLKRVCSAYNHYSIWTTDRSTASDQFDVKLIATLGFIRDCRSPDLAATLLSAVATSLKRANRLIAANARQLHDTAVSVAESLDVPAFARTARIEWLLLQGDDGSVSRAHTLFRSQLADAIKRGIVPLLHAETRTAFVNHFKTPAGQACEPWGEVVKHVALSLRDTNTDRPADDSDRASLRLITLARQCLVLGEPALAATIFEMSAQPSADNPQPSTLANLAALEYAKEAGDWTLAEACVQRALADDKLAKHPKLWRDAAEAAHHQGRFADWIERLDRANELTFKALSKTVNLDRFRDDFGQYFSQLDERAAQLADARQADRVAFARLVQRAASRWRDIDPDDTVACHRTATILTRLGLSTAAWNYWTTPLAEQPDHSTAWQAFATAMQSQNRFLEADRAFATAFTCEPTNPDILLQHAQFLRTTRQEVRAREMLTKITSNSWQPRFDGTKQQAQQLLRASGLP